MVGYASEFSKHQNMFIDEYRAYCLAKKSVTEAFPFDENTLVFKVFGKMFALTDVDKFESVNLKVNPTEGEDLCNRYRGIKPGYHMNKMHWITVDTRSDVDDLLFFKLLDDSYNLVLAGLPKKLRDAL